MFVVFMLLIDKVTAKRYVHTIKYLRFEQLYYRLYYFLKKPSLPKLITPPLRGWLLPWSAPEPMVSCLSDTGELGCLGELGNITNPLIWNSPSHSKLWLYNLHYFDALNAADMAFNQQILHVYIDTWIDRNPPLHGSGWEPYPLSLRVVNWIKWFSKMGLTPKMSWLDSLASQAEVLMQCIEYHLLGNHLFANGKALVFLGIYFSGKRADRWLHKGLQILDRELGAQFLIDGGHFELSPMYHASLMWDMCDLVNLANRSHHAELTQRLTKWKSGIEKGLEWLSSMVHPDGDISFFNDAAFGIAPRLNDLLHYASQLEVMQPLGVPDELSLQSLQESGYCVVHLPNRSKAILDVAKVGPDHQPGHAHADTLSFELSLYGQRFLVNSGISEYGSGPERMNQRATKAHNTVCIDGKNSSDVWSSFRVAKRAFPRELSLTHEGGRVIVNCTHDGYLRLPGQNIHQRTWHFTPRSLLLHDSLTGLYTQAEARFYFHPDVCLLTTGSGMGQRCLLASGQTVVIEWDGAVDMRLMDTNWYPYFGKSINNKCLVVQFKGNDLKTTFTW